MKTNRNLSLIMILFFGIALFTNCKKDKDDNGDGGNNPINPTTTSIISGMVVDLNNAPLQGVTVKIEGSTAAPKTTNQFGAFYFHNAPTGSRVSLTFEKDGYLRVARAETRPSDGVVIIHATMIPENSAISTVGSISGTTGGDVSLIAHNSKVSFAPNSIVDAAGNPFTGNVRVNLAYLDPTSDDFGRLIPGGDMAATNTANTNGYLYSYGIIKVELKDNAGNPLQLKNEASANATIEVGVPASMQGEAPATIPLWYFDETKGRWIEEGVATLTGNKYVGTVSHFTDWNCDVWSEEQATITGTVTDASGNPVAGVQIKTGQSYASTNSQGKYTRQVPSGFNMNVTIVNYYGHSETKLAGVLSPGETKTINFQVPQMNYLKGRIVNCNGTPVAGTVGASWGSNQASSTVQTTNGHFSIPVAQSSGNLTVWAYAGSAYTSTEFYPYFVNYTDSMPDIFLCDIATGPNQFTIDGAGYSNQTFTNFNIMKTAVYSEFDEGGQIWKDTYVNVEGEDGKFSLSFNNNITGSYTADNCWGSIQSLNGEMVQMYFQTLTLNVTKYGAVGQLIEGNFSATGSGSNGDFTISNGKFSVLRLPNETHGHKKKKMNDIKKRYKK